jgi:DNA-binding transcriptional ArsR family regulator
MAGKPRDVGMTTDEIASRYQAGATCTDLAAATGLARSTVHYRLKRAGVEMPSPSNGRLDVSDAEIVERYRAGQSCAAIAEATGMSPSTVHRRLEREGIERRWPGMAPGSRRRDLPIAIIVRRYREGETLNAIGGSFGVSGQSVRRRLIEAGVERRRGAGGEPGKGE